MLLLEDWPAAGADDDLPELLELFTAAGLVVLEAGLCTLLGRAAGLLCLFWAGALTCRCRAGAACLVCEGWGAAFTLGAEVLWLG